MVDFTLVVLVRLLRVVLSVTTVPTAAAALGMLLRVVLGLAMVAGA